MPHSTSMKGSFQAAVSGQAMTEIGKGFGRFSVRKPLMQEPAWALKLSYGDLCFGLVGMPPCAVEKRPRRQRETRPRPS